ncbi:DUF3037 domain-containing protein [Luteolibacter sp. AS25]|uniref:DUF3037 domain-containing protein n=1 Tax=Luteolibacter sp. AS25 TaxID=3135776 RepID=UPI00398AD1A5
MSLEPYSFCFLRYVHEPLSGEFANVGVLLWAPDSKFLGFKASQKFRRLSHFFYGFQQQDYRSLIGRIERQFGKLSRSLADSQGVLPFDEAPKSARELALQVIPHDDAALQWSLSAGGITSSPSEELDALFQEVVARHYDSVDEARRDDATIFREFYSRAFEAPAVKPFIKEHEVNAPHASHVFSHAWKNGVWNVYQPLSFDLKRSENIRNKAYHWESLTRWLSQSAERPNVYLLLAASSGDQRRAYEDAKDLLHASGEANLIEEDEAGDFARDLERRILVAELAED